MAPEFQPWKILHIDLSQELPTLAATTASQGYYLVFWWKTIPLGRRQIFAADLPLSAPRLADIAVQSIQHTVKQYLNDAGSDIALSALQSSKSLRPQISEQCSQKKLLSTLEEYTAATTRASQGDAMAAQTSVVICTRDRPQQLVKCLQSLQHLSPAPQEILVVDNAPTTPETAKRVQEFPTVRYVLELEPGLSAARNAGICAARGNFIAFTDDDVQVHPQWLASLHRGFTDDTVLAVTGLVIPAKLETEAQVIFELGQGCLSGDYQPRIFDQEFFRRTYQQGVPVWEIGAGANMIFRRSAFDQLGLFDIRLGAGASGCSEDSEFWYRILAAGHKCRYEPTAVVYHEHRQDLNRLNYQMQQYMRGHITALMVQFANHRHWGNLYRIAVALPKHYAGLGLGRLLKGQSDKYRTLLAEVQGCLAGLGYYFAHRRKAIYSTERRSR